jgi:predicted kinase
MQAIVFCGIQATGKSTFYQQHFFHTHVRISLDLLRTRHRENLFLDACLQTRQRFVVDNTNPTAAERASYIARAKAAGYQVEGYYFASVAREAVERNSQRTGKRRIPDKGIYGTLKRLEPPSYAEGFDRLYYVRIGEQGEFVVREWLAGPDAGLPVSLSGGK